MSRIRGGDCTVAWLIVNHKVFDEIAIPAVYIDTVAAPPDRSRLSASSVHFTPGARTAWHTDPNGQTIYVTEGVGLAQRRGGPIEVIRRGVRVFFEPDEEHWHGARRIAS